MTTKKKHILATISLIFCMVFFVLCVTAFAARGWIRGTFVLNHVRSEHLEPVNKQFEDNLSTLNTILEPHHLGITASDRAECKVVAYELIHASYRCERAGRSSNAPDIDIDVSFVQKWENVSSKAIEEQLAAHGWYKRTGPRTGLAGLLTYEHRLDVLPIEYGQAGKPDCTLTLYGQLESEPKYKLASALTCARNIEFFGGYEPDY